MGEPPAPVHAPLLAGTSDDFQVLHAEIGRRVRTLFPHATPVVEYGMAAWAVPIDDPPSEGDWKGTMPRTSFIIGPTEKKAGITLHIWHPKDPYLLKQNADWLKEAGFKPMVGCLQWNRKAPFPIDRLEELLQRARDA